MSELSYIKALHLGQAEYRRRLAAGQYPYLPTFEDAKASISTDTEVNLGLVNIPAERIVGTYSAGRRTAFAPNFMPLLPFKSEFGTKWSQLDDASADEGIRDPIKAVEFLNHYYVIEGNKRVSVLKFYGAAEIPGEVRRIMPRKSDIPVVKIYYEFVDFYRRSGVNYLWFREMGSFDKLETMVTGEERRPWTEQEKIDLHTLYTRFRQAFRQKGGEHLGVEPGDALMRYLAVHPYEETKSALPDEIADNLGKMWDEIELITRTDTISLLMAPAEEPEKSLISRIFSPGPQKLKVTFINARTPDASGWTYAHELGRQHLSSVFGSRVQTEAVNNINTEEAATEAIEAAVAGGSDLIFTTTPRLMVPSLKAAIAHPKARILNCSVNASHKYIRSYYSRLYEAKFLIGMIAGTLSENNRVGYLADYPIFGMTANINAFALGARMVNPRTRVFLDWSTREGFDEAEFIRQSEISYLSTRDMVVPEDPVRHFGLYSLPGQDNLAAPLRNWGKLYEHVVQSVFSGTYDDPAHESDKALNYLWGMSAGVIDLIYSRRLPATVVRLVEYMRTSIVNGTFDPFSGPLYAQDGTLMCAPGHSLSPEEVLTMTWLVDGVEGIIPPTEKLNEEARRLVETQGLEAPSHGAEETEA